MTCRRFSRSSLLALGAVVALVLTCGAAPAHASNRARALLNQRLPEVRFEGVALKDCIDFLRDVGSANIHVNWKVLEAAGISQDTPVNVRLRDVTMRKILTTVLSEAGGGTPLSFYSDEGVIEITTTEQADKQVFTRVYPVDDLLVDVPDFTGPDLSLSATSTGGSSGGGGASGGATGGSGNSGGGFNLGGGNSAATAEKTKTKAERADDLLTLIREIIKPEIWKENGGPASIRYYNGSLIVTAPRSVQEAIGGDYD